ncbi:UDP-3-O-(3-hydroxymyristoyl)glucosamine N-acyltransferase [Brevundimonas aveniformis]|uniref:UDP-3-O-(3-hydroxymyristoyl)glucosamine N-acyltransferase n=1 Tax=Brevundimonas aveniformis TaxID=370977 RepID=UPI00041D7AAB|nr:UDP-3-O-(3-hydroxymyristoyl)glucosamine N-acyltransferase [Brevundimonas aveniformis]
MPDARFFETAPGLSLATLAELTGSTLQGGDPDLLIQTAAPLAHADERSVAFLGDPKYRDQLAASRAGAVFVTEKHAALAPSHCARLITRAPQAAWAMVGHRLHPPRPSPTEILGTDIQLEEDVVLAPGVILGSGVSIGRGTRVGAYAVIGSGVQIGRGCDIGPNATLGFCLVGDRVRIGASTVIGEPGFGVAGAATGLIDVPQLGRVILQDDVTIGANTCIDRGAWDDTVIGEGTKIDNLVQIGHNCQVGRNVVLAGHTGLSGSVTIGDGAQLGGRAGVTDHVSVGKGVRVAAASMVMSNIPDGETWGGQPARPLRRFLRETVWLAKQANRRHGGADE